MMLFKVTQVAGCRQTLLCGAKATAAQHLKMQVDEKNIIQKDTYPNVHACSATQSCLTLCNPWTVAHQAPLSMEFSGKNTGAISFSRGSSPPRDQTLISCFGRQIIYHWATGGVHCSTIYNSQDMAAT